MKSILMLMRDLRRDEHGASAIEYAILASLVSVAFVVAASSIGGLVIGLLDKAVQAFS